MPIMSERREMGKVQSDGLHRDPVARQTIQQLPRWGRFKDSGGLEAAKSARTRPGGLSAIGVTAIDSRVAV